MRHRLIGNQSMGSEDARRMKAWREGDICNPSLKDVEKYFRLSGGRRIYREEAMAMNWDDWS